MQFYTEFCIVFMSLKIFLNDCKITKMSLNIRQQKLILTNKIKEAKKVI